MDEGALSGLVYPVGRSPPGGAGQEPSGPVPERLHTGIKASLTDPGWQLQPRPYGAKLGGPQAAQHKYYITFNTTMSIRTSSNFLPLFLWNIPS